MSKLKNRVVFSVLLLLFALVLGGCTLMPINRIAGSGNVTERSYNVADFNGLRIASSFNVDVTHGNEFAVTVSADDNLLDFVEVKVDDGTLAIGLKEGTATSNATLNAAVTMPAIASLDQSGASRVTLTGFGAQPDFAASLGGASLLHGEVSADAVTLTLSGGSRLTLVGEGGVLAADISGASYIDLNDFAVATATLALTGASDADVTVSGRLDVSASGASEVTYGGGATLGTSSLSGASTVTQR